MRSPDSSLQSAALERRGVFPLNRNMCLATTQGNFRARMLCDSKVCDLFIFDTRESMPFEYSQIIYSEPLIYFHDDNTP